MTDEPGKDGGQAPADGPPAEATAEPAAQSVESRDQQSVSDHLGKSEGQAQAETDLRGAGEGKPDEGRCSPKSSRTRRVLKSLNKVRRVAPYYLVGILSLFLILSLLLVLSSPDRVGVSPYMPVVFAFLVASLVTSGLSRSTRPRKDLGRTPAPALSRGAVWLMCFLAVVGTVLIPGFVDRHAELEKERLCARITVTALQTSPRDSSWRHVRCQPRR